MKSKAAMMVAVLGISSVGATSQKTPATTLQDTGAASAAPAQLGEKNSQYQTVRVFWPIRSSQR